MYPDIKLILGFLGSQRTLVSLKPLQANFFFSQASIDIAEIKFQAV